MVLKKIISKDLTFYASDVFCGKSKKIELSDAIFVGVGANIGDCNRRFELLISHFKQNKMIKILAISPILKNPPFGFVDQNMFFNFVIALKSSLNPNDFFEFLKRTENRFGRIRVFKNAPRTLDLDIIFFENKKISTSKLQIPHPHHQNRQSVMLPLSKIAKIKIAKSNPKIQKSKKVLVGLSGGVDSSVSAFLLQNSGFEVEGVYMKLHSTSETYHKNNLEAVAKVANFLGIKYHILDIEKKFNEDVFDYFVQSYKAGITPNPCVKCNKNIKFGAMLDFAKSIGADFLATGHYAKTDGKYIFEATDKSKDQSYFLAQVPKEAIGQIIFPMSEYKKEEIKKIAKTMPDFREIAEKKESQEICFVPTVYTDILKQYFDIDKVGDVLDESGKKIGTHKGYMHYTIGKRRGFTVNGAHDPHFIYDIDAQKNTIIVGKKEDLAVLKVWANELNMFDDLNKFECFVKLRYRSQRQKCVVKIVDGVAEISLTEPAFGVAIGQVAVFYDNEKILGSGWIIKTSKQ